MKWERAGKKIDIPLMEYLDNLIKEEFNLNHQLAVSVGTDSQRSGRGYKFATVILITVKEDIGGVIVGRGGKIISATYHMNVFNKNKEGILKWIIEASIFYHNNVNLKLPETIVKAKEEYKCYSISIVQVLN